MFVWAAEAAQVLRVAAADNVCGGMLGKHAPAK